MLVLEALNESVLNAFIRDGTSRKHTYIILTYIVKLGFTGVYIIFLTSTHNLCFEQKYEKKSEFFFFFFFFFLSKIFSFWR